MQPMQVLDLVQLTDSAFPSGSYAHSGGLEGVYGLGHVELEGQLRLALSTTLARIELPVARLAYAAAHDQGQDQQLVDLDELMDVVLPVRELREASRSIGRGVLRAANHLRPYHPRVEHHAVVFGAILRAWQLDLQAGLSLYAFQAVRQQLSAAQRLGKLGQSALQLLLDRLKPAMLAAVEASAGISRDEVGGFSPWLDLASMAHEQQPTRLFLS